MERGAEEAITIEVTGVRVVTWLSTIVVTYVASLIVRICVVVSLSCLLLVKRTARTFSRDLDYQ